MERMTWLVQLMDRMSGPAKRISNSLQGMQTDLSDASSKFGKFAKAQDLAGAEAVTLGGVMTAVTAGIIAAGVAYGALVYKLGEAAFSNFAFKESALATGKALWGSTEAAEAMFKQATQLAKLTPFNVKEVAGAFNKLGAAGFGMEEVPVVFQGLADIASMSGKGAEAIGSLTLAFSQIMGKGHLAGQELNQITEAAGGAVSRMKLFGEIAKIMGVTTESIDGMMQQGLIPARVAIMGVMQVAKQLGGGVIGQNSIEQSKTLGGLWSNLEDTVTNLWLTMDLTKMPWFQAVKNFMGGLVEALDSSTVAGKALQGVMDRIFGRFITGFIGDGTKDMSNGIVEMALAFETLMNHGTAAVQGLWEGLKVGFQPLIQGLGLMNDADSQFQNTHDLFFAIGAVIGDIVLGMATLSAAVIAIVSPFKMLYEIIAGTLQMIWGLLKLVGGGLAEGLFQGWVDASDVMNSGADDMVAGFKEVLGIKSPSRVFQGLGENVVQGFNQGVEQTPGMDSTLADDLAAGAAGRGGSSAGGGITVPLTIHIENSGGADADSIAQRLREMLPSAIAQVFDQIAAERGLA